MLNNKLLISLILSLVAFVTTTGVATGGEESRAAQILNEAVAKAGDRTFLTQSLAQIDSEVAINPRLGGNHYVRGWILSRLDRPDEAVAAYDKAFELNPTLADAPYNAGVILAERGQEDEALKRWNAAAIADPKHIDAYYNAAQLHYNRKEFAKALERWTKAQQLAPTDFNIAKKILQANNALGNRDAASKARKTVFEIWRTSPDDKVRKLTEYVFDQFDLDKIHVYAYETFEPKGDLYYVYTFRAAGPDGKVAGTVQLESSAVIREKGTPYIIGYSIGKEHRTTGITFKELPAYDELKPHIIRLIAENLMGPSKSATPPNGK